MKKRISLTITALMILFSTTLLPLKIVATINPYYLIVREIVGQEGQVDLLIGPGQNPHIFSPKISDVRKLNEADLVIANGLDLESFLESYLEDLAAQGKHVLYMGNQLPDDFLVSEDEIGEANTDLHHFNPHIWLDPVILSDYLIPVIVEKLSNIDPANSVLYKVNAEKLISELHDFDEKASYYLERFRGSIVIVAHPSFTYFFRRYGIELEPVLEGVGDEPSIGEIKELVDFVREKDVIGIFAEYQHSKRAIDILKSETAVGHGELDSLGLSMGSIIELLQWNLDEMMRVFDGK